MRAAGAVESVVSAPAPRWEARSQSIRCANCGMYGHVYRFCNHPVTSYGVILCASGATRFLVVRRRETFAFVEFMRGKYSLENRAYLRDLLCNMTERERQLLRSGAGFHELWVQMWGDARGTRNKNEYTEARDKFRALTEGYLLRASEPGEGVVRVDMEYLLQSTSCMREMPEWGFPKGRRNMTVETGFQCALRELQEETGISVERIALLRDKPFEETYTGTNGVRYRHIYYLARLRDCGDVALTLCPRELGGGEWVGAEEVADLFSENVERREMFKRAVRELRDGEPACRASAAGSWRARGRD